MTDELRSSLDQLRSLSPRLNKATDEATAVVAAVEKFLNDDCSFGMPASVLAWGNAEVRLHLAYGRVGPKFRIAIIEESPKYEGDFLARAMTIGDPRRAKDAAGQPAWQTVTTRAWAEGSRVEKLRTFAKLPELLAKLADEAASTIRQTDEACATVQQVIGALGTPPPPAEVSDSLIEQARRSAANHPSIEIHADRDTTTGPPPAHTVAMANAQFGNATRRR